MIRRKIKKLKRYGQTYLYKKKEAKLFELMNHLRHQLQADQTALSDAAVQYAGTLDKVHAVESALTKLNNSKSIYFKTIYYRNSKTEDV